MESLFSLLFKYRPFFFEQGEWVFQTRFAWWQIGVVTALTLALVVLVYLRPWILTRGRWNLVVLRGAFFLLLLFLALRPSLVLSTLVPRENMLGILADNSRSMGLRDEIEPRGAVLRELLAEDAPLMEALDQKFFVRTYKFDSRAERMLSPLSLDWSGDQTSVVAGLERILAESRNLPLAGILLFSDGSDNSYRSFSEVMAELKARQVPVYTVGIGPETIERDVEITQISTARTVLPQSVTSARVTLQHEGFGGSRGRLEVREGNSLIQSQEIYFPRDSDTVTAEVTITPASEGVQTYQFTLQPLEGERITENNSRITVIEVRNRRPRILYVEGHPRWEYKFIRQALAEDENIRLETLLRTALNKFYRQGIEEETTLAAGFPSDREELFDYKGVIFGSVESSFFDYSQMELVKDFVSKRGGGFMMLGGSSSFSSGSYQNTPIEQILPVWLRQDRSGSPLSSYVQGEAVFATTAHGAQHPALSLTVQAQEDGQAWATMPALTDWNLVQGIKPGTTVLAQLGGPSLGKDAPLLAFHRFGRGHAVALLTGSSWRWQMLRESEDLSHETFWRQMMRWLVSLSKDPVSVETEREIYSRNEQVKIRVEVNDRAFNRINEAAVEAVVSGPSGPVGQIPLRWSAREDGIYEGVWSADQDGLYRIDITARGRDASVSDTQYGGAAATFLVATGAREYFGAAQRKEFLQRLAQETGGRYYSLDQVSNLPEEIVYTQRQSSSVEVLDLWDMPINFLLLIGLLVGEWVLRKRYGTI